MGQGCRSLVWAETSQPPEAAAGRPPPCMTEAWALCQASRSIPVPHLTAGLGAKKCRTPWVRLRPTSPLHKSSNRTLAVVSRCPASAARCDLALAGADPLNYEPAALRCGDYHLTWFTHWTRGSRAPHLETRTGGFEGVPRNLNCQHTPPLQGCGWM